MINEATATIDTMDLENYFQEFKKGIIGYDHKYNSIHGTQKSIYADWIASGRLYAPIEDIMRDKIGVTIANTHSFSSETGKITTHAYRYARQLIKDHVNANEDDILITTGTGMTAAVTKLLRIVGLRLEGKKDELPANERPVIFITHMEHHSNHVPWMETNADVVILPSDDKMLVSPELLEKELEKYRDRPTKIGAFTACSNVTGIITPFYQLAKIMHQHGGLCFLDFAASAPYVALDMHPEDPEMQLDAIMFSPHKFLGGPGSCGVLVFDKKLYKSACPDTPGGGNVKWTTPSGDYSYFDDIESNEDGGTPGFLQVMRAALSIQLKDKMGVENIQNREHQLIKNCFKQLNAMPEVVVFGDQDTERIGCVSFNITGVHYNLVVRLLNDRYGIQVRGGWSCASTYSNYLFELTEDDYSKILEEISNKNLTSKPGWVRLSLHPVMSNQELDYICNAIKEIISNVEEWKKDYKYNKQTNEFECLIGEETIQDDVKAYFNL